MFPIVSKMYGIKKYILFELGSNKVTHISFGSIYVNTLFF